MRLETSRLSAHGRPAKLLGSLAVALLVAAPGFADPRPRIYLNLEERIPPSEPSVVWRQPLTTYAAALLFSPDGKRIALRRDRTVTYLDASNGETLAERIVSPLETFTRAIAISGDGKLAVTTGQSLDLYGPDSAEPAERTPCPKCRIAAIAFSPDGASIASQNSRAYSESDIGGLRVLQLRTGQVAELAAADGRPVVSFSRDGRRLLATHVSHVGRKSGRGFRVWDTSDWKLLQTVTLPGDTMGTVATGAIEGADFVAVYGNNNEIEMRDLVNDLVLWSAPLLPHQFAAPSSPVYGLTLQLAAVAPNGEFIVSYERPDASDFAQNMGGLVVRRALDGRILAVYAVPGVVSLAVAPDSNTFAYATSSQVRGMHVGLLRVPR